MKQVKLGDCIKEVNQKTSVNNQYPVLTSSKKGLYLQNDYFNKQVASKDNTGYKIVKYGQFTYRSMSDTGEFFINRCTCCDTGIVSPAYPVFEINPNVGLEGEYLQYYFRTRRFQSSISLMSQGSTRTSIKLNRLKEVFIPLKEVKEQKKVVNTLDKAQELINKRKEQIEACDELIKSQFIEMFGTIRDNPNSYEIVKLGEVCNKITDGKHGGCTIENGTGYYFVGAREISNGKINYETAPEISQQEFEKDYKRCNLEKGDFVIVNTGATIGKTAIADSDLTCKTLLQKSVALLKVKEERLVPKFLQYCYISNPEMYSVTGASAQPNLLLSKIRETSIYVPPIELQNQFAQFVQQVDKLKFEMEQSLVELENNFNSLMQRAFKGELF